MSQLERWFWTSLYFAAGAAVATALVQAGAAFPNLRDVLGLAAFGVCFSWLGFWRAFKRSIARNLGWGARIAIIRVRTRVNVPLWAWLRRRIPRSEVAGLAVYADGSDEQRAARIVRLNVALEELRSVWPARYERLMRLSPVIYIGWMRHGGGFFFGTKVIGIHESIVDLWQPESLVCVLCHELSHMYVAVRGVRLTPWAESRFERIADMEMGLWGFRLLRANRINAQISAELTTMVRESRRRWWWRRDGTRVHGREWEMATPTATATVV